MRHVRVRGRLAAAAVGTALAAGTVLLGAPAAHAQPTPPTPVIFFPPGPVRPITFYPPGPVLPIIREALPFFPPGPIRPPGGIQNPD
ncbi:hypothetical protein [Streptomyces flaveolus]|uniref:hypothetical protein n=1 Tax=Streptomyces flaveolus TaxID=67297 RepID=UPI0036BC601C